MSEFHVNVVRLTNVQKHPNADSLFIAKIHGGYPIIFKGKQFGGAFEEGDLAVYIPVDSLVPATEEYAWLSPPTEVLLPGGEKQMVPATVPREKDRRVRAKRLREVFSMGMLGVAPEGTVEGQDVAELMGITKYEEPEEVINASQTDGLQVPAPRLKAMPSVYDIEGLRRYTNAFKTGEAYVVTEKLHGCVPSSALVTMADGSRKRITSVEEGDQVMGMTIEGKPTATKVLRKYDNGKAEEGWLKITGQRRNAGRGSSFFALRCTPNHKVWNATAQEYVEARNLKRDDRIVSLRSDYKSMLVEQTIDSVEVDPTVVSNRYDMETETHNYFCNGVLVHNCNARFVHDGEKLHVGSRTRWLTTEERNTWADAATRYELAGKIAQAPGLVFFGETYGNNTDMPYGVTRAKTGDEVRFFDIWDSNTGTFLDHDMFVATCTRLSLDMAPELCRGTWSEGEFEKLAPLAEGKTTLGGGHVREGFVIKPLVERCMDRSDGYIGGRLILKLHGEGFLTRKSAR